MRSPNQRIKLQFRQESIHRIYMIPRTSHEKNPENQVAIQARAQEHSPGFQQQPGTDEKQKKGDLTFSKISFTTEEPQTNGLLYSEKTERWNIICFIAKHWCFEDALPLKCLFSGDFCGHRKAIPPSVRIQAGCLHWLPSVKNRLHPV